MQTEGRLKVAAGERTAELQKLRYEIDETRRKRLNALAAEKEMLKDIREADEDITRAQAAITQLKSLAADLKSDIAGADQEFDTEKQAYRLERQRLLVELEEITKSEKQGLPDSSAPVVHLSKSSVFHNIARRKKNVRSSKWKRVSMEQKIVSFEQKKLLLDRVVEETNVKNMSEFIQKYNDQERIKAEVFARIEVQTATNASLNESIAQLTEDIGRLSGAGDSSGVDEPSELQELLDTDDAHIKRWMKDADIFTEAVKTLRGPIFDLYKEFFPDERAEDVLESTTSRELGTMRRIGAIEERIMQFVMAKILEETGPASTPNNSDTLKRLRQYQGRREQHPKESKKSTRNSNNKAKTPPKPPRKKKVRSCSITDYFSTPERDTKRRRSTGAAMTLNTPPIVKHDALKPWTPSETINSSMNASLVFDMVTSLSTNDPGVAIATLRSIVVLGKEYPSDLLYTELIERIQSPEAVAYSDAVAIYAALVFVFDKAASCSCAVTFPNQWDPLNTALQEVSGNGSVGDDGKPKQDESWRRNLLVMQFYIYCFQQDFHACRSRYQRMEEKVWVYRTRLFSLLQSDSMPLSAKARAKARTITKVRNNKLMLQAIGWVLELWKRVYDADAKPKRKNKNSDKNEGTSLFLQQEGETACLAAVRLIEMLFLCTDQPVNALQRVQAGLVELSQPTRVKFSQTLQSPALRTQLAATMIGLSNKSRSKETEWYECNALGRVMQAMNPDTSGDVAHTEGYSWSHFDSFINLKPGSSLTKLLQEVSSMQQQR
ncbi:hypothetical protein JM18_001652 [Phytophthora kernoviae]|uniref:Uncharacterized protein n=3 Tax=Phytophthora kernoviae TaxID=325452 RepID=A0A921VF06_9STRA|nr:hypothetical protein JM18_001652 [Phytophthora kernoviae]